MRESAQGRCLSLEAASRVGPPPRGNLAIPIFATDGVEVELYEPQGEDRQRPHSRDEIYFVARGEAEFFNGEKREPVSAGSFIFVPAGNVHRFEEFSGDFAVWVVFFGPERGQRDA